MACPVCLRFAVSLRRLVACALWCANFLDFFSQTTREFFPFERRHIICTYPFLKLKTNTQNPEKQRGKGRLSVGPALHSCALPPNHPLGETLVACQGLAPPRRRSSNPVLTLCGESMARANGDATSPNCGGGAKLVGGGCEGTQTAGKEGRGRDFASLRAMGVAASKEDREAAINMLPNADPTIHSCDACNKDITGVRVDDRWATRHKMRLLMYE